MNYNEVDIQKTTMTTMTTTMTTTTTTMTTTTTTMTTTSEAPHENIGDHDVSTAYLTLKTTFHTNSMLAQ